MFGLGWSEMVLVAIVALIVIGPKDLPGMFRTIGQMTGKARGMAREFSRAMEQAADESGVKDISSSLKAAVNPQKFGVDKLKEATGFTKGPTSQALSEERAAAKAKASDAMAKAATLRKEREAVTPAIETPKPAPKPAAKQATATKPTAKKPATPKTATPKTATPKPAAKKPAAKKPAAKKPAAKPKGDA